MKARVWLILISTLVLTALSPASPAALRLSVALQDGKQATSPKPQTIAFVEVNVVPMDRERVLTGQTVVVKEGRIVELGPAERIAVPKGALRVDGRGKYLLPGLADMHVHLHPFDEQDNRALLQLFLANGVTTILNLLGTPHHLELRERINRGALPGPTLYTSGPYVSNAPRPAPTVEEVEQAVVEQKRVGYDFIKIHGDFSREAYSRLFEVARRENIRVIGHAPRNLGIEAVLEERQHVIAHAEEYLYAYFNKSVMEADKASKVPAIAEATAKAGVWVIPNLTAYKGIWLQAKDIAPVLKRPEVKYVPKSITDDWQPERNTYVRRFNNPESVQRLERNYRLLEKLVKGLRDAGVRMLAGTDAPIPSVVPGFSLHDELADLVAAGLTPYEAIKTATTEAAECLGVLERTGTVAVGKRADLILLEGDPLKDVRNTTKRAGVMVGGRWLGESELRQMLNSPAAR
jgi:imidazolonepropionase-like amidohydrolase